MTDREIKVLNRIPKKYRGHIVNLSISETNGFDSKGRWDYTITYDNDEQFIFGNQSYMFYMLKEYSVGGYYVSP